MGDDKLCPFCRVPAPTSEEDAEQRVKKRIGLGDAVAIHNRACSYGNGIRGFPQDYTKALELWHQSAELGNAESYYNIGSTYMSGNGVERNEKKAIHYWELAAMGGNENARHNLGITDSNEGNYDRALKHYMIAVGFGNNESLKKIKQLYTHGQATKDDYAKALQAYQAYLGEIKSNDRDKAAEYDEMYKYYE